MNEWAGGGGGGQGRLGPGPELDGHVCLPEVATWRARSPTMLVPPPWRQAASASTSAHAEPESCLNQLTRCIMHCRPCACLQPLAHRVLGIPRGDPKKTDVAVSQEQLETLDKFKGACGLHSAQSPA